MRTVRLIAAQVLPLLNRYGAVTLFDGPQLSSLGLLVD